MIARAAGLLLLAAPVAAQAPVAPAFPCERLAGEVLEHHAPLADPPAPGPPVALARKASLYDWQAPLVRARFTADDPAYATAAQGGGAVDFVRYTRDGRPLFCTGRRSDALFGAGDAARPFLQRCLTDADADGRWDGVAFVGKLVRIMPGRQPGPPPPDAAPVRLPVPIALAPAPPLADASARAFVRRLTVVALKGDVATLRAAEGVVMTAFPATPGDETQVEVALADGAEVPVGFARVRFARAGHGWTAALAAPPPPPARSCDGAVFDLGGSWQALLAGGSARIAKRDLDAAR